jgi:hypothetical protein
VHGDDADEEGGSKVAANKQHSCMCPSAHALGTAGAFNLGTCRVRLRTLSATAASRESVGSPRVSIWLLAIQETSSKPESAPMRLETRRHAAVCFSITGRVRKLEPTGVDAELSAEERHGAALLLVPKATDDLASSEAEQSQHGHEGRGHDRLRASVMSGGSSADAEQTLTAVAWTCAALRAKYAGIMSKRL